MISLAEWDVYDLAILALGVLALVVVVGAVMASQAQGRKKPPGRRRR